MSSFNRDILYDTFSFAGKASLRKYNIKLKKKKKNVKKMNLFVNSYIFATKKDDPIYYKPDFKKKIFKNEIDESDILSQTYRERNKNLFQGKNYKYHKRNEMLMSLKRNKIKLRNDKEISTPLFFKTNKNNIEDNKMKFILNWKKLTGRKPIDKEKEMIYKNLSDIDIKTDNYKQIGFVDMSKQTQRDENFLFTDIRNIYGKKYVAINTKLEKEKWEQFRKTPLIATSPLSSDLDKKILRRLYPLTSKLSKKKISKIILNDDVNKSFLTSYRNNSVINFKKNTGRENLFNNIKKDNNIIRSILHPKYNYIEERVKMMVTYKNDNNKKDNKKINLRNAIWDGYYSTTEKFENIYGHKLKSVPIFKQMMSRPSDEKLPSFMKGINNRMADFNPAIYEISDYCSDKSGINKISKNDYSKKKDNSKNKNEKSEEILKKFINLYGELHYPPKKIDKKKIVYNFN